MKIPTSPILSLPLLLRGNNNLFSFIRSKKVKFCSFFGYARTALQKGLKILGLKKGDSILLPSYMCDVILPPIFELGVSVKFYKILPDLRPNVSDIQTKINRRTKAILVVNYFGFPQDMSIQKVAKDNNLYIIEDNAHSFLSEKNSRLLGTFGDIGISCLRKTLPVPDGAFLFINNKRILNKARIDSREILSSHGAFPYIFVAYRSLSFFEERYNFPLKVSERIYHLFSSKHRIIEENYKKYKVRISEISLRIANNLEFDKIALKRRENYEIWLSKLSGKKGLKVVFKMLPKGVVPQVFPVIVMYPRVFMKKMRAQGIPVSNWPTLPREIKGNKEYSTANLLAKHLVTLPVHQSIEAQLISNLEMVF